MTPIIEAWFVLVVSVAGWLNREQDKAVQYLLAENKILKEHLQSRGGRIRFTDKQGIPPLALGCPRSRRLLHGGGMVSNRIGALPRVLRHRDRHPTRPNRRHHPRPVRPVDGANRP